jgi:hypothetical protein
MSTQGLGSEDGAISSLITATEREAESGMTHTDRRTFMETLGATAALSLLPRAQGEATDRRQPEAYTVAAYYFGNYHVDPKNEVAHGPGWTE